MYRPKSESALSKAARPSSGPVVRDFNKDRLAAKDVKGRSSRLAALNERRSALREEEIKGPPLVRAPRRSSIVKHTDGSKLWHRQRVQEVFEELDFNGLGEAFLLTVSAHFIRFFMFFFSSMASFL